MQISSISKCRSELMGIAILNVMVLHSLSWTGMQHPGWLVTALRTFGRLIFTDGFLFLSGFGLFYSCMKSAAFKPFYMRRFTRLMILFIVIAGPFFMYYWLIGDIGFDVFLLKLSTLYFWFMGNDGMWYISVSVILYLLYPVLFRIVKSSWWGGVTMLISFVFLILCIYLFVYDYYKLTSLGIPKMPMFILGIICGRMSYQNFQVNNVGLLTIVAMLGLTYMIPKYELMMLFSETLFRIVGIAICCMCMMKFNYEGMIRKMLRYIGNYTLDLYLWHMFLWPVFHSFVQSRYMAVFLTISLSFVLSYYSFLLNGLLCKKLKLF